MSLVEVARDGEVAVLRLNRPEKLNAISSEVERALHKALVSKDVRRSGAVVVAGEGRAFSAGADISEFEGRSPEDVLRYYEETGGVYEELAALPQPTVGAIHGYCLGGARELALALDFRIADENSVFGFPEVSLGILASSGGLHRVTRLLGPARAKELFLLAERFGADDARRAGLVTEVVEEGKALDRALEVAVRLAALPHDAVAVTKQAIDAASTSPREAALLIERLAYAALAQTQAARDAAADFGES
ncbi:MAG: enoyl-CoA hydratase/isomerase family protein [Gaiellaceae bacterium]